MKISQTYICATREYNRLEKHLPAYYFRKNFEWKAGDRAKIGVWCLGFYELYINGVNVTKGRLAPYICNSDQLVPYDEYDVTAALQDGKNTIGVWLGNGMQNNAGGEEWHFHVAAFRSAPKFALALCKNGEVVLETDESFVTKASPITFDDLRSGERYDARKETLGWNLPDFDDSDWANALIAATPKGKVRKITAEPIRVTKILHPVSVTKTPSGKYIYDFGENFTGVCRLRIRGKRGQVVKMLHGERLLHGELDIINIQAWGVRGRKEYDQMDIYTLKGGDWETYTPRFTYHGFQYVSVDGITDEQATLDLLTFEVMHSNVKTRGDFVCSDVTVNRIQEATRRSDLSNLFYIPTDCPHREKNGWTADIALSAEQMMLNFDVDKTLTDWLFSVCQAQDERGAIPGIVPTGGWGFEWGAGPAWDIVIAELPYEQYHYTGDTRMIKFAAKTMKRYLEYVETKRNEDGLFAYGLKDWCPPAKDSSDSPVPLEVSDSITIFAMCQKMILLAQAIGDKALEDHAASIGARVQAAYKKKYIKDGKSVISEQTAIAMAIYYGIAKDCNKTLEKQLLAQIHADNDHFTTGVLGARVLFRVLSDMGETDLAYKMITQPTFPSYTYHIVCGATTLFESFWPLKDGVWGRADREDSHIDSLNHHFWGDVSAWFIKYLAGIKVNPTYADVNTVEISPAFVSELDFAEGYFLHKKGRIDSGWAREDDGSITLRVRIPKGVAATLCLPKGYIGDKTTLCSGENCIRVCKNKR